VCDLKNLLVFAVLISSSLLATKVSAESTNQAISICNQSDSKAFVAEAWYEGIWVSSGWVQLEAGDCGVVLNGRRSNSGHVYIADDYWTDWKVPGVKTKTFCLQQTAFTLDNAEGECSGDMIRKNFMEADSIVGGRIDLK
jgi:uncharacterized membrane protein